VLSAGAGIFSKLTTDLVITPIETMIEKVNNITKDPLKAAYDEEERLLMEEFAKNEDSDGEGNDGFNKNGDKDKKKTSKEN
jgi:hypothetical protein